LCRKVNDLGAVRDSKGDRILATNFIYMLKEPRRWDPVIFKYPRGPRKDFIKRLIAFPGEEVQIIDGDIYIDGEIAAKPLEAQEAIWMQVYDSNYPRNDGMEYWKPTAGEWRETKGLLKVKSLSTEGFAEAIFGQTQIYDIYGYNHNSGSPSWGEYNIVSDLKVSSEISFEGESGLVYGRLGEKRIEPPNGLENTFAFEISIEPQETGAAILKNGEAKLKKTLDTPFEPGLKYRVDFMSYDDTIILKIDGEVVLRLFEPTGINDKKARIISSPVALGSKELAVNFGNLKMFRDIYYTRSGGFFEHGHEKITVEEKKYWVMGDNSPESSDSRTWGFVPENALEGRALLVWWPPWRVRIVR
jgi:signal peptidase I